MFRTCIVLAALAGCGAARAERAVLPCIADTAVSRGDRTPHGSSRILELSSKGAVALTFRTGAVEGWRLQQAVLLLHVARGEAPYRLRLGALNAPWSESTATWHTIRRPKTTWRRVRTYDENWIAVDVSPQEAVSAGLLIAGADARFDSRESGSFAPYLLVEGVAPGSQQKKQPAEAR